MNIFSAADANVRVKVLLIEDDEDDALLFRHALPDVCSLVIARNAEEGMTQLKKFKPDILFLDLRLPGQSGEELCKQIRTTEESPFRDMPIIMVSGKATEADQIVGKVIGANAYLTKPYQPERIMEVLKDKLQISLSNVSKSNTVLLIDDDHEDSMLVEKLINRDKRQSYHVRKVSNLKEGMKAMKEQMPDAIICDLNMPGYSAAETCEALKGFALQVPCIILTGFEDELLAEEALRRGIQDYICKDDLDSNTLSRSLRHAIERFSVIRKLLQDHPSTKQ